eukprot:5281273-Pyramimonas_sp.AAC.3
MFDSLGPPGASLRVSRGVTSPTLQASGHQDSLHNLALLILRGLMVSKWGLKRARGPGGASGEGAWRVAALWRSSIARVKRATFAPEPALA